MEASPPAVPSTIPVDCLVFVVDDDQSFLETLQDTVESFGHPVTAFSDPQDALGRVSLDGPTLLLADKNMPQLDGISLAERAYEVDPDLAIIILTGDATLDSAADAVRLGILDYLEKPVDVDQLNEALQQALTKRRQRILHRQNHAWVQSEVEARTKQLEQSRLELGESTVGVLAAISAALDARTRYYRGHSERVASVSVGAARQMGLDPSLVEEIRVGALLHDIGMLSVPDSLLEKPDVLSSEELAIMQRHPEVGASLLKPLDVLGSSLACVLSHHERWDGSGYPEGLIGDAIPLAAQIVGVAEVWCALTAPRPFREPLVGEAAQEELGKGRGVLFSGETLDALFASLKA